MISLSLIAYISLTTSNNDRGSRLLLSSNNCPGNLFCSGKTDGNYQNPTGFSQNYFVSCVSGIAYCMSCPANLVYDAKSNRCEYGVSSSPPTLSCPDSLFCSGKTDGNYKNPDGYSQSYYVACVAGQVRYCMPCPANLVYDQSSNRCKYPSQSSGSVTDDDDDNLSISQPVSASNGQSPSPPTSSSACPDNSFCLGKAQGNYQNPDKYSQNYFIQCVGEYLYCTQCPAGLRYNPNPGPGFPAMCVYPY